MYAVYVLEDTWRLRATFSTRDWPNFRRSPCRSRAPRQGVPHGGDAEEGGMKSPIPAADVLRHAQTTCRYSDKA